VSARERRQEITRLLLGQGNVRVSDLAQQLGVSDVTIRSDLAALERKGSLQRIHGGAIRPADGGRQTPFQDRLGRNGRLKRWLGRRAAALVDDGERIFVDSSTTAFAVLSGLQDRSGLTVVTNGIDAARSASENPRNRVMLIGGQLRPGRASLVGPGTEASLRSWGFDKAFVSCSGFNFEDGFLEEGHEEAAVKRAVVASANEVIALVDSTKLATAAGVAAYATLSDVDQVLVDELAAPEHIEQLLAAGVPISVCGDGHVAQRRGGAAKGKRKRIGFANLGEDHPFPFAVRLGLERAASGVEDLDLLVADNAMSGPTALKNVDYFIEQGADIVIEYQYHADYGAVIMSSFREADIPVIAVDVPLPGATYFGVDNYVAGQIGGNAAAVAAMARWGGSVDRVVSLDLGAAGRTPAARMQGQLDALRDRITVSDDHIVHIDAGISRSDTQIAVADMLHAFPDQARLVYLAGTDEAALGAIDAIKQAGVPELSVVVSQGADAGARAEMLTPGSPLVGAVSYVPERYGPQLIELALAILERQPTPPAVYIHHELVTADSIRSGAHDWLAPEATKEGPLSRDEERPQAPAAPTWPEHSAGRRDASAPVTPTH
jgi:ribose transport system substrate-binding protein